MGLFNRSGTSGTAKTTKIARKEIEGIFRDIQINLENNYKDLAIAARKRAEERLEDLKVSGELADKDYKALKKKLDEYTERMKGYHH